MQIDYANLLMRKMTVPPAFPPGPRLRKLRVNNFKAAGAEFTRQHQQRRYHGGSFPKKICCLETPCP